MANTISSIAIDLSASTAKLQGDMNRAVNIVEKSFKRMERSISNLTTGFAAIGAGLAFGKIVEEVSKGETALAQLEASLKSTKGAVGLTSKQLQDMSSQLQKVSTYGDDTIQTAQSLLLTFTKIGKETFPQATKAVLDMSAKMGVDLKTSAIQVGKALNDPIAGLTALKRVGVSFSEGQQALIKSLVESGHLLDAQKIILRELQTEFGGSAQAARGTLKGAIDSLNNSFGDFLEAIGHVQSSGLRNIIEGLTTTFDEASKYGKELSNAILGIAAAGAILQAAKIPALITTIVTTARTGLLALGTAMGGLPVIIAGIVAALITFKDTSFNIGNSQVTLWNLVVATWEKMQPTLQALGKIAVEVFGVIGKTAIQVGSIAVESFQEIFNALIRGFKFSLDVISKLPFGDKVTKPALAALQNAQKGLAAIGKGITDTTSGIISRAAELTKVGQKSGGAGGFLGGLGDSADALASKVTAVQKFFNAQQAINKELQAELTLNKQAAELEKLKAEFHEKVGRDLLPNELAKLKEILDTRNKIKALQAVADAEKEYSRKAQIAELERKHMNELIPGIQRVQQLQDQGITLTDAQINKIRELSDAFEKAQLSDKTNQYIDSLKEANDKLERHLNLQQGVAEILDAQVAAAKQNKFISNQQLADIAQQITKQQDLQQAQKFKDIIRAQEQQYDLQGASLIQNKDIRDIVVAELQARQQIGRALTDEEKQRLALITIQRTYLDDAKRAQEIINANKTEQEKFNDTVAELQRLFDKGLLSWDQFSKAVKNASPQFEKIKGFAQDTANAFRGVIDDILSGTKKISDAFKDLGKQLLKNLTNKFLLDPLEKGISNFITGLFNIPTPLGPVAQGNIGSGIGGKPSGFLGSSLGSSLSSLLGLPGLGSAAGPTTSTSNSSGPINSTGPIYASGPVYMNGTGNNNPLSNIGSLVTNLLKNIFGGIGSFFSGLVNVVKNLFSGNPGAARQGIGSGLGNIFNFNSGSNLAGGIFKSLGQSTPAPQPNQLADLARQVELFKAKSQLAAIDPSDGGAKAGWAAYVDQLQNGRSVPVGDPQQLLKEAAALGLGSHPAVLAAAKSGFKFAQGGRPPIGRASLVGEKGPEMFVPDVAGRIIPNHELGGGAPNISVINNTSTPIHAGNVQVSNGGRDISIVLDEAIAASLARGGQAARQIKSMIAGPARATQTG